jgi:disulfide bond formation protein DsbB
VDSVPRPAQTVVFVVANVAAGVAIVRWWAPLIVLWPLMFAATGSTGTEDTRWGLIGMVAVPVTMGAILIVAGALAAKIAAAVRRSRRSAGACAHP